MYYQLFISFKNRIWDTEIVQNWTVPEWKPAERQWELQQVYRDQRWE